MLGAGAVLARARRLVARVRIGLVAVLLLAPLALSILPAFPPHGHGHMLYVLPLLLWLERPERTRRLALYLLAVGLQVLAFPEPDFGFLGWILLWPYLFAREVPDGAGWWRAAYFFGFFRALVGYSWLGHVHYTAWIGVALASGLLFSVLFEGLLRWATRIPFALRAATGWMLFDWIHSMFFGGLPWLYIGHTQHRYLPVIQIADIVGAWGVTCLLVYVQVALFAALRGRARIEPIVAVFLLGATLAYGWTRRGPDAEPGPGVLLVQSAVPHELKESGNITQDDMWDLLYAGTRDGLAAHPDTALVVWPETMHPYPLIEDDPEESAPFHASVRTAGYVFRKPFVYGVATYTTWARYEGYRGHNSAVLARAPREGDRFADVNLVDSIYRKQRLVPMGEEFLPRRVLPEETCDRWFSALVNGWLRYPSTCDLESGDGFAVFDAGPGLRFAPLICFEGLYSDMTRDALRGSGADFLLQLVNNGWFGKSWEQRQMVAIWVFRSVETRTASFNCANAGVSCVIGPDGAIVAQYDAVMKPGFCHARVPKRWAEPIFLRGGHWILPGVLAAACALSILLGWAWNRTGRGREGHLG